MKKVGIIIGQLSYGGAEKQAVLLAQGLAKTNQYEPIIFCLSRNTEPYSTVLSEKGLKWFAIPTAIRNYPEKAYWLIQQVRLTGCSLLYGFLNTGNIYTAIAAWTNRIPYICSIRNVEKNLPHWMRLLSGLSCDFADYVIANSPSCTRSLRDDLKVRHNRVEVIKNALDFPPGEDSTCPQIKAEWGIPADALIVGTVANIKKQKNPLLFVDVFEALDRLTKDAQFYFVWIGDGPERVQVDNVLNGFSPAVKKRIVFPGARHDILNVLKAFDIFILTSSYEGLPNALLEAMAAGLPCVATRVNGTIDVVGGVKTDLLVWASPNDPSDFAATIQRLINNKPHRVQMGEWAQTFVTQAYSLEQMVQAHCKIFNEVINGRTA